jgi:signal transduction histidine kinase
MCTDQAAAGASRHKCLVYAGDETEQFPVVMPFLTGGLQDNWRCLYLGNPRIVNTVRTELMARDIDVDRETKRGALILSSDRDHLGNGTFHSEAMVENLAALADSALRDGFQGLCATGDMKWEFGSDRNFGHLLEYEALLEKVLRDKPVRALCQYHRDILPAEVVHDALLTHRGVHVGRMLNDDNLYYVPPEILLNAGESKRQGEWMCEQIVRVLNAEQKRDQAMTALRGSEEQQRCLADQLAEANRELERRVEERTSELRAANQHLEAFSYSVSHDLRRPLQCIMTSSEMVSYKYGDLLGEDGQVFLDTVCSSVRNMGDLIEGLLSLGQVLKTELKRARVDLSSIAGAVMQEIRAAEPQRQVEVVIEDGLGALGDPVLLRAVLTNLLSNAWKFTSQRPKARIEIGQVPGQRGNAVFFVKDNGAGFEMSRAAKLFGAFQRLHHQEEFPGTGIGLATVQRIIARHGGEIWAEAKPGQGATFCFSLPLSAAQKAPATGATGTAA